MYYEYTIMKGKSTREKYKIILISPGLNSSNYLFSQNYIPLGLMALAAVLKEYSYDVKIYQPRIRLISEQNYKDIASDILSYNPGLIGFSTWCVTYPSSLLTAKHLKALKPQVPVIFGGPQASVLSKETLRKFSFVDYVLEGECDYSFPEFLNVLFTGNEEDRLLKIPGLTFRSGEGEIIQTRLKAVISNLDELPVPEYNLYSPQKLLVLDVGRGCPFKCTYCSTNDFFSKTYRTKSTERIIHEMDMAFQKFKINHFSFAHDMFTLNKSFVKDFCNKLIQIRQDKNRKYYWNCSARIDCVSEDLLALMKEAGCEAIFFGIESGSEKIQHSIQKNLKLKDVHKIAEVCLSLGIEMHASFIIGFPDETDEDFEKTLRCILTLTARGVYTQVSELSLLPGTPLYKKHKESLKFDGKFSNFSNYICNYEEIKLITAFPEIFSSFYYLPVSSIDRYSLYNLQNFINLLGQFRNILFIIKDFLKHDIENISLLSLVRIHIQNFKEQADKGKPSITYLVKLFKDYLISKNIIEIYPFIYDVFAFESIKAMIQTQYGEWLMIQSQVFSKHQTGNQEAENRWLKPVRFWRLLTTDYPLNRVLPSANGWQTEKIRTKKGSYNYLLVAVSEKICNVQKITRKESIILNKLADDMVGKTSDEIKSMMKGIEVNSFWKKMIKFGLVKIMNE